MTSGYRCKLRQVPLKVLPFCRVPVKFIGYLTRPLGFFFVSVDTDKSSKPTSETAPRLTERIWGLTFAKFCGIQKLIATLAFWEYIVECLFGCWNGTFCWVKDDLNCSPDGSICRVIFNSKYTLLLCYLSFLLFHSFLIFSLFFLWFHQAREQRSRWE